MERNWVVDKATGKLSIQMRTQAGLIVSLPYQTLSDTMRRMIFYTAAIRTSRDHIIILEEPEALSFPPYISQLAKEIIEAANQKQFFINTHSPYLLNTFIEQTPKDKLAVFVCSYSKEEKQTKARRLTQEELSEVLDYGVDLFFNLNPYLNDPTEHSM
jgi:predicted ATPase